MNVNIITIVLVSGLIHNNADTNNLIQLGTHVGGLLKSVGTRKSYLSVTVFYHTLKYLL